MSYEGYTGISMKYTDLHYGQIPTTYRTIKEELYKNGSSAIFSLLKCFVYDVGSNGYMIRIIVTANYLERISCLVYKSSDGKYKKLPEHKYKKGIFEGYAETPQEIYDIIQKYGVSEIKAERIHKMVWQIADLVCPMMACMNEHAVVSEYIYAIDYVIRHGGDLPKPNMVDLFPRNYPDYKYWEDQFIDKVKEYIEL